MTETRPVVVGVDASPSSLGALNYAAELAARWQAPLHLFHGYQSPLYGYAITGLPVPLDPPSDEQIRRSMDSLLRQEVERVRTEHAELVAVQARLVSSAPAPLLIEQSRDALATVVGCRGVGGFTELLLGSVSSQLAAHGHGPVIVIRPPVLVPPGPEAPRRRRPLGPVVACYDGSSGADAALSFAAAEAAKRQAQLIVTHVYNGDDAEAEQLLVDAVKPLADHYDGLPIELRPIYSRNTDWALVEASRNAALTVVGSRGRGGFAGLLLGSISRTLVHHSYGPVAVIHTKE